MKILLDEHIPIPLKKYFGNEHVVKTVKDMKWLGVKNGQLLALIDTLEFDFLVTADKGIEYQQNLENHNFNIFLLKAKNTKLDTLRPLVPKVLDRIKQGNYEKVMVME